MLTQYLMLTLTQLTWQNPPFRHEFGVQSLMLTSQFVPVHPTAQLHWYPFTTSWNKHPNTTKYTDSLKALTIVHEYTINI